MRAANNNLPLQQFDDVVKQFALNPKQKAHRALEKCAKEYVIYSPHFGIGKFDMNNLGYVESCGKLIYTYENGVLEIFSRVELTSDGLAYSVFRGALV